MIYNQGKKNDKQISKSSEKLGGKVDFNFDRFEFYVNVRCLRLFRDRQQ